MMLLKITERFSLKEWLVLAILLRLLIMPFFYHPDLKTTHFKVSFLKQGVVNIYSFLDKERSKFSIPEDFNYFPLTYFFLGGYQWIASPLLGEGFNIWLNNAAQEANDQTGVFRYLFLLKLPYLILDLSIAFVLLSLFSKEAERKKVFLLWLYNPVTLTLIYVYSNIDIIPVFFTAASLALAYKGKLGMAALMLGLGASFKAYPLLFLPFLVLESKSLLKKIQVVALSLGSFLITIAPFYSSPGFKESALQSGLTTRIIYPGLSLGFGETLMASIIALSTLFFFGVQKFQPKSDHLWKYLLAVGLLLLSFIHFHIQWILWLMPFMVLAWLKMPSLFKPSIWWLLVALSVPLLYEDKFMTVSLLTAINSLFSLIPIPFAAVQKIYDPYAVQSVFHSAMVGGSLIIIWQLMQSRSSENGQA